MTNRAWVTLATNDSYGLGALVLAHSLRRVGSTHSTVVLITPSVTDAMRDRLRAVFTEVVTVDVLDSRDAAHLALLQRPELGITFTKIHCWELTQYEKCVFLDADTLVVQNCDELFEREELSAAPDVGWPDCFNSGVFVYKPSAETFDALIKFARDRGSFDGGDQGLLNSFFSDWARGDINKHLPFLYNVTSAAFYSYLPALKHYGQDMKIIHFIGAAKPWLQPYNWESRSVDAPEHIKGLLQLWWDLFVGQVHQQLDSSMVEDVEVATPALPPPDVAQHYAPSLDPQSEFLWHHPDAQQDEAAAETVDITEYYDPWQNYRGNIPPNPSIEATDDRQAVRDYAWEYKAPAQNPNVWQPPSGYQHDTNWHKEPHHHHTHSYDHRDHHSQGDHSHIHTHGHQTDEHQGWCQEHEAGPFFTSHDNSSQHHNSEHDHGQHGHTNTQYPHDHHYDHTSHLHHDHNHSEQFPRHESSNDSQGHKHFGYTQDYHPSHDHNNSEQSQRHELSNDSQSHKELVHAQVDYDTNHSRLHVIHHVHIDYENTPIENREAYVPVATEDMNGFASETESCDHEDIKPRHPYDNYYLKHRASIDPYGRKICSHEIPPTPSPSPPPEPMSPVHPEEEIDEPPVENQSGVAGNLARVVPGAAAREAVDELTRRQGWEAGNIDYMGADSFDNIWAKISQTLNQPRTSPPKQQSPPKEAPKQPSPQKEPAPKQPSPPKVAPAEAEPAEAPVEAKPAETSAEAKPAEVPVEAKTVEKPADVAEPVAEAAGKPTPVPPAVETPAAPAEAPAPVPVEAPTPAPEAPVVASAAAPVEAAPAAAPAAEAPKEEIKAKTDKPEVPPTPPATPKSSPEPMTPVGAVPAGVEAMLQAAAPASPVPVSPTPVSTAPASSAPASSAPASPSPATTVLASQAPASPAPASPAPASPAAASSAAPPKAATPEKALDVTSASSDSPPLANTPLKEDAPKDPAAKSEERERRKPAEERERRMPAERLQLCPPAGADPLATPDSELEDAASLAHAIIASELAPPGAVSLAQIGVKPKGKSTAAHIESSVVDAPAVPATPTAEAPVIPKAEGPVTPSAQIPATPSAEAPATPSAVAPTTPSAKAPTTPSAEAPTTPSAKAPTTPSAKAPTIPSAKAPTTPSAKAPTTTSAEAPTTPIANAPATPSAEAPATPSADVPRTPSAEAPVTPSAEAPATPSAEAPATPSAEAPATPSAETPVTPSAEAPASPAAEAAPKDAPKKKIIKKVVKKEGDAPVPPPRKKEKKPKDK